MGAAVRGARQGGIRMNNFPESDWKILSRLKPLALDRLCERIVLEAEDRIARARSGEFYRAYLDLYKHIRNRDKTVSNCFDDWTRSQAFFILANWRREKLVTDEEFAAFSPETRIIVDGLLKM
jgi:hypothetical protein